MQKLQVFSVVLCIDPFNHIALCRIATVLVKLTEFAVEFAVSVRLSGGSSELNFCHYSSCFATFKNVVHSLEPSHQAPNYVQRS